MPNPGDEWTAGEVPPNTPYERLRQFLREGCDARPADRHDALNDLDAIVAELPTAADKPSSAHT